MHSIEKIIFSIQDADMCNEMQSIECSIVSIVSRVLYLWK